MRILHITDSHGTVKSPEGRRDVYYTTFLKKLFEVSFVCKRLKVDFVIHTGDLFHSARVSNKFAGQTAELIKAMKVPFYVVPGNHDIEGYSIDTIDQTTLGLLAKTEVITILDRQHPLFKTEGGYDSFTVAISGQEYYAHIDEGNARDFLMQQNKGDFNILAIHGYITDTMQHPNIKYTLATSIKTDADIILSGHYHHQFVHRGRGYIVYNPGSMMRVDQTEYNKTHIPQYGIIDIFVDKRGRLDYTYTMHPFSVAQPSTEIFDYEAKYREKCSAISLDSFKSSVNNTIADVQSSTNIPQLISQLGEKANVPEEIVELALSKYNTTLQNIPDEFEAPHGFIESLRKKRIQRVLIQGFQSHEDTCIEFDKNFNVITGASNAGKTSVFRAILWAIDNKPLGTDFIMAGKPSCKVRVVYDDGTFIERGRTRKDTGYYTIRHKTPDGVFWDNTFKGFTNAVPIDVTNTHQMPVVNITKDIETHLNVLGQLDRPFLISETPPNKAAAIGRITGTHVIDAAIKDLHKDNRNLNISITNHRKDLDRETRALLSLSNYDIIHEVFKGYEGIYDIMSKRIAALQKAQTTWQELQSIKQQIEVTRMQLEQNKLVASLLPIVSIIHCRARAFLVLNSAYTEFDSINTSILQNQRTLSINKPLADSIQPVERLQERLQGFIKLCSVIDSNESIKESINKLTEQISLLKSFSSSVGTIFSRMRSRIVSGKEIDVCYHKYLLNEDSMVPLKKTIVDLKADLAEVKQQVQEASENRNEFIRKEGICPCCNQRIRTNKAIKRIIDYMEEKT